MWKGLFSVETLLVADYYYFAGLAKIKRDTMPQSKTGKNKPEEDWITDWLFRDFRFFALVFIDHFFCFLFFFLMLLRFKFFCKIFVQAPRVSDIVFYCHESPTFKPSGWARPRKNWDDSMVTEIVEKVGINKSQSERFTWGEMFWDQKSRRRRTNKSRRQSSAETTTGKMTILSQRRLTTEISVRERQR